MPDDQIDSVVLTVRRFLEGTAIVLSALLGLAVLGATTLAIFGVWPWLSVPAMVGDTAVDAGPFLQSGLLVLMAMVFALTPGTLRVRRLETTHRNFQISMNDVTRAYYAAHAADRAGLFQMHREFDAMRERMEFLRHHPDLGALDPEILELAAQMSTEARSLAEIYSDENVAHAEAMLLERQSEADRLTKLIERAHGVSRTMRQKLADVDLEEDIVRSRIEVLREELEVLWADIDTARPASGKRAKLKIAGE